ncbi:extracellular solute-binding protein [Paenibacillus sp. FSL H8-0537]|uniref:extracellular solute-binding protein n=1 Tax=Paenibacillus sp. FSL H8-0537 TaxID=2921399 RepID=UPI003101A9F8
MKRSKSKMAIRKWMAGTFALTVLVTGCSNGGGATPGASSSSNAGGAAASSLKVEIFDRGNTPQGYTITDSYLTRYVKDNFSKTSNIDVQFVPIPRSEEIAKLNVLMASGDDVPDIVFTYDQAVFERYAEQGGLADLTDLLNEHGQNLKKFLGDDTLAYGQLEGKQFAIPGKRMLTERYSSWIRKDWLDKVGLPMPSSTDELYEALKAFKEKDPGETGGSVIPLGMTIEPAQLEPLLWSFIQPQNALTTDEQLANRDYLPVLPGFKEGLRFMNKLYNEGLMSKDFGLDQDKKQLTQDIQSGKIGMFSDDYPNIYYKDGVYDSLVANSPNAILAPIDPFTNAEGLHAKPEYAPNALYIMVPKSSKHAVEAIKYLDWMSATNVLIDMQNGVLGENYELKDGIPVTLDNASKEATDRIYNFGDIVIVANGKIGGDEEKNKKAFTFSVESKFQKDFAQSMEFADTDTIAPVIFNRPIASKTKYGTTLDGKLDEMIVKTTMAAPDKFDSIYDAAMADYMSRGGKEVMDERTKAYTEAK